MMKSIYYIWLQAAIGAGARTDDIISAFSSPRDIYEMSSAERRNKGVFTPRQLKNMENVSLEDSKKIITKCHVNGFSILPFGAAEFPERLKSLRNCPLVLYVWGDLNIINDRLCISVVGTRKASEKSMSITVFLSAEMADAGAVIVSGAALGIDSAAHSGALYANGKTVAVLGCGIEYPYLQGSFHIRKRISENGAVISEFPPGTAPVAMNFPIRNRIISGLSEGTLVVEANERSGSLITAQLAGEQGRDLFAVPGDITDSRFLGANKLIRDGARPVFSADDIINCYTELYPYLRKSTEHKGLKPDTEDLPIKKQMPAKGKASKSAEKPKKSMERNTPENKAVSKEKEALINGLEKNAKLAYSVLGNEAVHIDDIARSTEIPMSGIIAIIFEMELCGLIESLPGKYYRKV